MSISTEKQKNLIQMTFPAVIQYLYGEISTQMAMHSKPYQYNQLDVCLWMSHTELYILIHKIISAIIWLNS
jgi:hypothetical protein